MNGIKDLETQSNFCCCCCCFIWINWLVDFSWFCFVKKIQVLKFLKHDYDYEHCQFVPYSQYHSQYRGHHEQLSGVIITSV